MGLHSFNLPCSALTVQQAMLYYPRLEHVRRTAAMIYVSGVNCA